ncbi:MAG: dihydrolipoyl dehydrogenase family protein [Bacillus sp. (in: firmicutes)]
MVVGELTQERDLIVIGGGPGGYSAAIRAAQLGIKVMLIEKDLIGGICLNKGCIPSKILAQAAKKKSEQAHLHDIGFEVKESFHYGRLKDFQQKTIKQLRKGIEALCASNKVELVKGEAAFLSENRISVSLDHQFDTYSFKQAIIATGSSSASTIAQGDQILFSENMFDLPYLPDQLTIHGHSYIALEAAFSYSILGCSVELVMEKEPELDLNIYTELKRQMKKLKIKQHSGYILAGTRQQSGRIISEFVSDSGDTITSEADFLLVDSMRRPKTELLGIERLGIRRTEDGFIETDEKLQTNVPSIYAIGDTTIGPQLAVKAIRQGKVAAEAISGLPVVNDLSLLPSIVHTVPPIAAAGLSEEEARAQDIDFKTGLFPLGGNGYAALSGQAIGLVKVIVDAQSDILLGIHMIGSGAVELSSTFIQALEMAAKVEDLSFPAYAHPSVNEALLESIENTLGQAIHLNPKKQSGLGKEYAKSHK